MELLTPRLLRSYTDADADDVCAYASDPRVGPAAGWPPSGAASAAETGKSRRVVEKSGVRFQFSAVSEVAPLKERRLEYHYVLTREEWECGRIPGAL